MEASKVDVMRGLEDNEWDTEAKAHRALWIETLAQKISPNLKRLPEMPTPR